MACLPARMVSEAPHMMDSFLQDIEELRSTKADGDILVRKCDKDVVEGQFERMKKEVCLVLEAPCLLCPLPPRMVVTFLRFCVSLVAYLFLMQRLFRSSFLFLDMCLLVFVG